MQTQSLAQRWADVRLHPGANTLPPPSAAPELVRVVGVGGVCVHGILIAISRGSAHIESATAIDTRIAVDLYLSGCIPLRGQVIASKRLRNGFRITVFFDKVDSPALTVGSYVWAEQLATKRVLGKCPVLDVVDSFVSIVCDGPLLSRTWVRLDTAQGVFYGETMSAVPVTNSRWAIGVSVDVALPRSVE